MPTTAIDIATAFGYLTLAEIDLLKRLAQSLPDSPSVVNIGAGSGTSGLAFMESRPDLHLITIDIQDADSPLGCLSAERNLFKANGFSPNRWEQVVGDSVTIGRIRALDGFQFNMVFVDGNHDGDGPRNDIEVWLQHLVPDGVIAIHDYDKVGWWNTVGQSQTVRPHPHPWPDVDRAVNEMLVGKYEFIERADTLIAFRNKRLV